MSPEKFRKPLMSSSDKIDLTFLSLPSLSTSLIRPFLFFLRFPIICIYDTPGHKGIVWPVYDFGEWEVKCVVFYPGRPFRELAGWLFRDSAASPLDYGRTVFQAGTDAQRLDFPLLHQ